MSTQQLCLATHFRRIKDLTTGYRFSMLADSRNGAIFTWILSQALGSGCFSSSERFFYHTICGILRVMGDLEFTLSVFGTERGSVRRGSTCYRFLLDDVMTPYAWLRKFFRRFCDYAKAISCRPSQRLESNRHVVNAERHREKDRELDRAAMKPLDRWECWRWRVLGMFPVLAGGYVSHNVFCSPHRRQSTCLSCATCSRA